MHAETNGMRKRSTTGARKILVFILSIMTGSKSKAPRKSSGDGQNVFTRPVTLSKELAEYLGEEQLSRSEMVKRLWAIAREEQLFVCLAL
ncbi:unnamed protein product [Echinostoma caproni]|uniref:DM2 domain-containing protein n=1 Tax=Echinostoma caproni TaxID=27848 RepID=A0A3P8LEW4_9TREM|nr:unnamed protein product [Echinostoma caproni]